MLKSTTRANMFVCTIQPFQTGCKIVERCQLVPYTTDRSESKEELVWQPETKLNKNLRATEGVKNKNLFAFRHLLIYTRSFGESYTS